MADLEALGAILSAPLEVNPRDYRGRTKGPLTLESERELTAKLTLLIDQEVAAAVREYAMSFQPPAPTYVMGASRSRRR